MHKALANSNVNHLEAAHYRREAKQHRTTAERSRAHGNVLSERVALGFAQWADDVAFMLETGIEPQGR